MNRKRLRIKEKGISGKIDRILKKVQELLDKDLLKDIGTPKMSALTHCKLFLQQSLKYAKSYEKHCEKEEVVSNA